MSQDQFLMLVRMLLQMAGVVLVSKSIFTETDWTAFAGGILTIAPIAWSFYARRAAGLKQTVATMPNTVVVTQTPSAAGAVGDTANTTVLASKIAAMPEVHQVVTTAEIAQAAPSAKVVS